MAGEKRADLRADSLDPGARYALLYDPDVKQIVGGVTVARVLRKPKHILWRHVAECGIPKNRFDNYFRSRKEGTAIIINGAERFDPPIALGDVRRIEPNFFVPLSVGTLPKNHPLIRLASSRSPVLRNILSENSQSSLTSYLHDDYRIRGIKADEIAEFQALVQEVVGGAYDDIDTTFTKIILDSNREGADPLGYFTLTKRVWVAADVGTDAPLGYVVTTEKRGGSVKYGPTIIKPESQGRGLAVKIRRELDDAYARRGFRKGYSTIPAGHTQALKYLMKAGYNIEAHLSKHYRSSRDEFVLGRVYGNARVAAKISAVLPEPPKYKVHKDAPGIEELHEILQERVTPFYDGIDKVFARNVLEAHARYKSKAPWETKAKQIFTIRSEENRLCALLIGTPKRGGAVKMTPIATRVGPEAVASLVSEAENFFFSEGNRKMYALVAALDSNLVAALTRRRYRAEGVLREPYRPGIDMIVYSRFRGEAYA